MIKQLFIILVLLSCLGCSAKLRTLINVSNEQKAQGVYINEQNRKFSQLIKDIDNNKLKLGLKTKEVINLYGEPIDIKPVGEESVYLYRDALKFFPTEKVYLYFDREDKLRDFKVVSKEASE